MVLEQILLTFEGINLHMGLVRPEQGSFLCLVPIRNDANEEYFARFDVHKRIFIDDIFGKGYDLSCFPGKTQKDVDCLRLKAGEIYGKLLPNIGAY